MERKKIEISGKSHYTNNYCNGLATQDVDKRIESRYAKVEKFGKEDLLCQAQLNFSCQGLQQRFIKVRHAGKITSRALNFKNARDSNNESNRAPVGRYRIIPYG